jgi:hypothetical protein
MPPFRLHLAKQEQRYGRRIEKVFQGQTELQYLALSETSITDAGLEHLKGLTQLEILDLDGTRVTDAGLEHLSRMTQLKALTLWGAKVSSPGVKKLQTALPNCEIYWKPPERKRPAAPE